MIHVSLTSELPWLRNDAIKVFTCLCISRHQELFRKSLKGTCTSLRCLDYMAEFEQFPSEYFGFLLERNFNDHKNSE